MATDLTPTSVKVQELLVLSRKVVKIWKELPAPWMGSQFMRLFENFKITRTKFRIHNITAKAALKFGSEV